MNISNSIIKLFRGIANGTPVEMYQAEFAKYGLELWGRNIPMGFYVVLRTEDKYSVQVVYHANGGIKLSILQETPTGDFQLAGLDTNFCKRTPEAIHDLVMGHYIYKIPNLQGPFKMLSKEHRGVYILGGIIGCGLWLVRTIFNLPLKLLRGKRNGKH